MAEEIVTVIEPPEQEGLTRMMDALNYRELLFFLVWRDIKVRYRQTVIGVGWAIIRPLFTMIVFSVVFGALVEVPSDDVPYPVFSYAGLVPWTLFSAGLGQSASSLVGNANLLKKVYFPRIVIPAASVLTGLVDFISAMAVLFILMALYGIFPSWRIVLLPLFVGLAVASSLGVGLIFAALNVQYRDIRHGVPFLTQLLVYGTPIAWPSSLAQGEWWYPLLGLNPMAGVVEGFRWALYGHTVDLAFPGVLVGISTVVCVVSALVGVWVFNRREPDFADIV